ncbi:hypothetical protein [Aquimarina agarilytica]|uniref:hypothetical protein n=1 Tax=Aquimarina agarilytica TaxID=1087449 RepID=UPI000289C088|nr:hypothetical protein [Aquimarina agarilytica]
MPSNNKQDSNCQKLYLDIKNKIGKPVNVKVVRATIESFGIRNIDTSSDFGFGSIESLAKDIYIKLNITEIDKNNTNNETLDKSIAVSGYQWVNAKLFIKHYPLGLFHLIPIFLQIASIIIFRYSLWTYLGFNKIQSTAVVLGVILGLIITGGFVQVIGRQASYHWYQKDFDLTKKVSLDIIKLGIYAIVGIFLIICLINFLVYLYPFEFILTVFVYSLLIGALLLVLAPMHTIKKRGVISVAIILGTFVAILLKIKTDIHIYFTHWIGISLAIVIAVGYFKYYFNNKTTESKKEVALRSPRISSIIYKNYQYFTYGVLLYAFVFLDRILAWSSSNNSNGPLPYILYYDKDYEIGMDIAILSFFLLAGVLEYSIVAFSKFLDVGQKEISFENHQKYNQKIYKMYRKHIGLLLFTSLFIGALIYNIVVKDWGYQSQFGEALSNTSKVVCCIGAISYTLFSIGLLNTLYLFTLNRPSKSLNALAWAFLVNLIIGLLLSRNVSYEYSVLGMFSGAFLFMILTTKENIKFFKKLDYYYYASY